MFAVHLDCMFATVFKTEQFSTRGLIRGIRMLRIMDSPNKLNLEAIFANEPIYR